MSDFNCKNLLRTSDLLHCRYNLLRFLIFFLMSEVGHGRSHLVLVSLYGMCNLIICKMVSLNLVQSSSTVLVSVELKSELFSKEIKSSFIESHLAL